MSVNANAGDLLYGNGFTKSQRNQVEQCYKLDSTFAQQISTLTAKGDIALEGMFSQENGYMFMTMTNTYGRWIDYIPLHCDLRSQDEIDVENENIKKLRLMSKKLAAEAKRIELSKRKDAEQIEALKKEKLKEKLKKKERDKIREIASRKDILEFLEKKESDCIKKYKGYMPKNFKDSGRVFYRILPGRHSVTLSRSKKAVRLTNKYKEVKYKSGSVIASWNREVSVWCFENKVYEVSK
ncbi:MAG: hypothetical protein ACI9XJ_002513 [Marivirga sp.]|jgi:hypothetical protein